MWNAGLFKKGRRKGGREEECRRLQPQTADWYGGKKLSSGKLIHFHQSTMIEHVRQLIKDRWEALNPIKPQASREKKNKNYWLVYCYHTFFSYIFPLGTVKSGLRMKKWEEEEEKKTSIYQFAVKFICIGFYVGCVLHKIGMFWFCFSLSLSPFFLCLVPCNNIKGKRQWAHENKPEPEQLNSRGRRARAAARLGKKRASDPINFSCGFQVYCCQLKYGYFAKRFPSFQPGCCGNWN